MKDGILVSTQKMKILMMEFTTHRKGICFAAKRAEIVLKMEFTFIQK